MLAAAGRGDVDPADALADGRAYDSWRAMISAQGGDPDAPLPIAQATQDVLAPASGTLTRLDAMAIGLAAWRLGAGPRGAGFKKDFICARGRDWAIRFGQVRNGRRVRPAARP